MAILQQRLDSFKIHFTISSAQLSAVMPILVSIWCISGLSFVRPLDLSLWTFNLMTRLHQDTCCRIQVVSTCRRLHVSCVGDKIVRSASLVCYWIQRDTSRPWHKWLKKWIVIMSPRYSQHVSWTSNLYPLTLIRRHICIRIQVARPGYMYSGHMCSGVNALLQLQIKS